MTTSHTLSVRIGEETRLRVEQLVRQRWIEPAPPFRRSWRPATQVDDLAGAALDAMLTRPFRISRLPAAEERAELLTKVRYWVQRGKPIRILLGHAPMKNLNSCPRSRADWAEFFALTHLCAWHNKVASVYRPGLRIKLVFDDATVAQANRADERHMDDYIRSIDALIDALGYRSFLVPTMRQSSFTWLFHFGIYQVAQWRVQRFERDPANREVIEQMDRYARRNVLLPPDLNEAERQRAIRTASHRYRVCWEALQISGLSKHGRSLIAMYLDGHQHHIKQPAALHLATLGKEQVTQPWQGEGALRDNGRGKLVPVVLTAQRRARMALQPVDGLRLLPLAGFDSIQIGYESDAAADRSAGPIERPVHYEAR